MIKKGATLKADTINAAGGISGRPEGGIHRGHEVCGGPLYRRCHRPL
jgi:hypothetical protein